MCGPTSSRQPPRPHRVLIVDDHPLVRRGLRELIDGESDLTVCAAVAGYRAGIAAIVSFRPDLVVADLSLGDEDDSHVLALLNDIRSDHEHLPVLVLTMRDEAFWAERAFRAGAGGYFSKQELSEELLDAIRRVLDGERYMSPEVRAALDRD